MIDLQTKYLGLRLESPIVASASPCTGQPDVLRCLEHYGAGAAVLPSLFEEQVAREGEEGISAERIASFPHLKHYNSGSDNYAALVEKARLAVTMPIIASLNGTSLGTWVDQARRIADAGADAVELNLHCVPVDPSISGQMVEAQLLDVVAAVRGLVSVPLAVKLGPYFSSLPYFARQLVDAGANGIVMFNRFFEPEINLVKRSVDASLQLSHPAETRLALRWLGILRDQLPNCSFAASGGIHDGADALKAMAVGADVVMLTSSLLKNGADYLQTVLSEMVEWLRINGYGSTRQLVGSMSRERCGTPEAFERANYAQTLSSYMDDGAITS